MGEFNTYMDEIVHGLDHTAPLAPEYLDWLQLSYRGNDNTINYVTTMLGGLGSTETLAAAENEALSNIYTAAIEHPLADAVGEYNYSLNWEAGMRLRGQFGYLDEIIQKSIDNESGQVPEFERRRNQQNLNFYNKLQAARSSDSSARPLVEFSPSPLNMEDAAVKERGYKGNDTVLFYELDEDGREQVVQKWFPRAQIWEYRNLAHELYALSPSADLAHLLSNPELTDTDIMAVSGEFSSKQLDLIKNFVSTRQNNVQNSPVLQDFLLQNISTQIRDTLRPKLRHTAQKAVTEQTNLKPDLDDLLSEIRRLQFELRLFIKDEFGRDTFTGNTRDQLEAIKLTYKSYMDLADQMAIISDVDYEVSGCGFSDSQQNRSVEINGSYSSITSSLLNNDSDMMNRFQPVNCSGCGRLLGTVNIENVKTFFSGCSYCQKGIRECDEASFNFSTS